MEKHLDRIKLIRITLFIFISFYFVNNSYALNASSASYSVSMFGNSVSTGRAVSNNYEATFLSENIGTTSNSEGNGLLANIGFFDGGPYSRTVSISSYSISPRSTVVGNTIGLSINAINAQNVWAKVTSPNSQIDIINLINNGLVNYLPIPSIVGRYNVEFYANDSNGNIASIIDYFDLTVQNSAGSGGGSTGSSGGGGIIERCTYNWDCTPWSVCSKGIQTRSCKNIGTCTGIESKPLEVNSCSQSLFDISLNLDNIEYNENYLKFRVYLQEKLDSSKIDVHIKYSIIDSSGSEIFYQIETKAVDKSLAYEKIINNLDLVDGDYIIRIDVLYGNLQRAFTEQKFNIVNGDIVGLTGVVTGLVTTETIRKNIAYSLIVLIFSGILLAGAYWFSLRDYSKKGSNLLSNVHGLDVYADNGVKIGSVDHVILQENRVYGLVVSIIKNVGINHDKVIIPYKFVQNIQDVVVVNSIVLEHSHETVSA